LFIARRNIPPVIVLERIYRKDVATYRALTKPQFDSKLISALLKDTCVSYNIGLRTLRRRYPPLRLALPYISPSYLRLLPRHS
jgi:hypothetical protein